MELINKFFAETAKKSKLTINEEPFNLEEMKKSYSLREWFCEEKGIWYVFASKDGKTAIIKLHECRLDTAKVFTYLISKDGKFGVLK